MVPELLVLLHRYDLSINDLLERLVVIAIPNSRVVPIVTIVSIRKVDALSQRPAMANHPVHR